MPRVVVFGSSNTDMTVRLPRLPAPGQTILGHSFLTTPGGKGANQAVAARRAGAEVVFVTAVGDDDLGRQALELYRREGIDVGHARVVEGVASGVALIFVADDGENMIGVAPGANLRLTPEDVDRLPDSVFREGDVLLVSLEIPLETAIRAIRRGFDAGMFTILNPAPAPTLSESEVRELLEDVDVLTPNRVEAMALAGIAPDAPAEPDWAACGRRLVEMGAGCRDHHPGIARLPDRRRAKPSRPIPAPRVEAVDTVGAGDAFNGALAVALAEDRDCRRRGGLGLRRGGAGRDPAGRAGGLALPRCDRRARRTRSARSTCVKLRESQLTGAGSMIHRPDAGWCLLIVAGVAGVARPGEPRRAPAQGHDRPAGPLHKTRSAVMARQGMAATSQPLATATAIRVLQQGGNAVDAAIAANAVLGVVEPMSCGIGGDLFAIVWDAKTGKLVGLNASGRAPAAATIELFRAKGLDEDPGPRAAELVGARVRRRLGPAPPPVRHAVVGRAARPGDRLRRPGVPRQRDHRRRLAGGRAEPRARSPPRPPATCPAGTRPRPGRSSATRAWRGRCGRSRATAATPSTRGRWPTRSSGTRSPPAACSATRTSPSTPARSSTRSRPITAATTSGSCRPTARGSPRSRCSTCSSRTTSRPWGRSRPRRCT